MKSGAGGELGSTIILDLARIIRDVTQGDRGGMKGEREAEKVPMYKKWLGKPGAGGGGRGRGPVAEHNGPAMRRRTRGQRISRWLGGLLGGNAENQMETLRRKRGAGP